MDKSELFDFMSRQRLAVVSSLGPDGTPQSALVDVAVTPELEIVFDTLSTTRKHANLTARPRCSVVLGWSGEQTVQLEGVAALLEGEELERCRDAYFAALPNAPARVGWPGIAYFVVRPRWIRFSDFEQSPPLIMELTLQAGSMEPVASTSAYQR
ncbi:MAG TPA: pyridoxamine 5'-phosphate oxidase family protein [Longimicrobiales bacterium]